MKGAIVLPLIKGLRGNAAEARKLLPPEYHRYLEERILLSSWYPEDDHLVLLRVLARILNQSDVTSFGHMLAQYELGGVYRSALHEGDLHRTLQSFARLWPLNHDTGSIEVTARGGGATLSLTGYVLTARELCEITTGYLQEGLRMAMGGLIAVEHTRCRVLRSPACVWRVGG